MTSMVPQSIAVLSSVLRNCGIETNVFDTTFYSTDTTDINTEKSKVFWVKPFDFAERGICGKTTDIFADFKEKINTFNPNLIAISFVEDTFRLGVKLLESIREYNIPIVAGGVFCTYALEKVAQCSDIDFIVRGEGELPLKELCLNLAQGKNVRNIANICY